MDEGSPPRRQSGGGEPPSSKKTLRRGKRSQPRSRGLLSAEAITEAAFQIADADGIEAVSIRRVAAALDARPMSLYIHFESKDDLVGAMAEQALVGLLVDAPMPDDWREGLSMIARKMYAALTSHPWLITIFSQRPVFGPNAARQAEQFKSAVAALAYEEGELWWFCGAINDYVLGHSLRAMTAPGAAQLADRDIGEEATVEFPELAALPDYLRSRDSIERFEFGLKLLLDGIEQRYQGRE